MSDLLSHVDWKAICGAAAALLLQSSLVLILGLSASRILRKRGAAVRSAVLRATLAAVILCPAVSLLLHAVGIRSIQFSLPLLARISNVTPADAPSGGDGTAVDVPSRPVQTSVKSASTVTPSTVSDRRQNPGLPVATLPAKTQVSTVQGSGVNAYAVCAMLWFIVAALLTLRLVVANALLAQARYAARPAPDSIRQACERVARKLHVTAPDSLISRRFQSPCLVGWLSPAILLPQGNADVGDDVLLHEIAHVVRRDCLWQLLARLTVAALWFQPLAWLLVRQMERTAEEACDDVVLAHGGDRAGYARRLVELAERLQPGNLAAAAAVGVVSFKSAVGKRIARLLDGSNSHGTDIGRLSLMGIVLGSLLAAASAGLLDVTRAARAAEQHPDAAYRGQVLTSDGRPVAGADVYLVKSTAGTRDVIESTRSDSQGNFELHKAPTANPEISPDEIQAHLPGQGVGAERYDATKSVCRVTLRPSTRITLTILDPDAKPVAGMKVYPLDFVAVPLNIQDSPRSSFFFMNMPLTLSHQLGGVTDDHGRIILIDVPQGTKVRIGFDDERFAYPDPRKRVGVSDHEPVSPPATLQLDRGAIATGTVRYGPTGKPAAGISVSLQGTSRSFSASGGSSRTGDDGTFRIAHLNAGEFNAMIRLDKDFEKDWTAAAHEWVKIQAGQTLGGLDFTLIKGGIVTGKVTMADSGKPITNTQVGAYGPARPRSSAAVQGTAVGPDGSYNLRVPPGMQHVYIMGLLPQAYRQDRQMSQDVKVEDGQIVALDFKVPRQAGEAVAGVVLGLDGKPAANIPVKALTGGIDGFTFASTDAAGHFHFDALAPSTPLTVQSDDLATAEPVYVQKGQGEVKLQLVRRVKLTLKGLITDEQGNPVPNARIRLSQQMGRFGRGESTPRIGGADGRYEIRDLYTDNQYSIAADADGFGEAQTRLHLDAGTKDLPTLKLPRADSTTGGVVVDAEGKPVAGVTMHLNNGMSPKTAITDAQGRFSFPVVAGKYHLIWIAVKEQGKVGPNANGLGGRTDLKLVLPKEEQ